MPYFLALVLSIFTLTGCQSAYYSAMEQVGYHKRDIMVDRVEDAKESQQDAQEEFTSALEALSSLTNFNGGDLEDMYNKINDKYQDSEKAAQNVSDRISAIEDVSDALFAEWQDELDLYTSASLRRSSEQKLRETKSSYQAMLSAMKRAEKKMDPVLNTLRDNTLYLKHNLNASAIGSLQGEFMSLEKDIAFAIKQMNEAIAESDKFLAQLNQK
jgi:Skp family chaperone for outer membrane proteins